MKKNQNGFTALEALLVLFIVIIISFLGWYTWHRENKSNASVTGGQTTTSSKTSPLTKQSTTGDAYVSWNTYCDNTANVCVKYPADWVPHDKSPAGPIAGSFISPDGNLELDTGIIDTTSNDGSNSPLTVPAEFYTDSLNALSSPRTDLKVWGGYLLGDPFNVPRYQLIDTSLTGQNGLKIGVIKSTTDPNYPSFTLPSDGKTYGLLVYDRNQGEGISKSAAQQWLNSTDGKLALKIVQSTYFK